MNADGTTTLITERHNIERWTERVSSMLSRPSSISVEAINILPQSQINEALAATPTLQETAKAINGLSNGKTAGVDYIQSEIHIAGGNVMLRN